MIQHIPNQNIPAEECVLTSLLVNNNLYYDIDDLKPEHFYLLKHQTIYKAIKWLLENQQVADLVTVATAIQKGKHPVRAAEIAEITDSAPIVANIKHYADLIKKSYLVRETTYSLMRLVDKGFDNPKPDKFLAEVQGVISEVDTVSDDNIQTGKEIAQKSSKRIHEALNNPDTQGLKTGFYGIDEITNISGSKLILIAARPKVGKTSLMTSIMRNMLDDGVTVGCLSLEMDEGEITNRWIGELADVNPMRFRYNSGFRQDEINRIHDAHFIIDGWNLFLDDKSGDISDIERKCRKMKRLGCEIIFIDQLSKIRGEGKEREVYAKNTARLADLKKELRIPIVLLCQLNREGTERPTMNNLGRTGALEEDADMIFILHREPNESYRTTCALVAHRQGGVQDFELDFTPIRSTFNKINRG